MPRVLPMRSCAEVADFYVFGTDVTDKDNLIYNNDIYGWVVPCKLIIFADMMIMITTLFFSLSVVFTTVTSPRHLLEQANAIMKSQPDSALALLKQIDTVRLCSQKQKAEYALAYVAALDKNYIDTTNVALINPALKYYRRCGTPEKKMMTYYYLSCLQRNARDYASACVSNILAWREAEKTEDLWAKGMICSALRHAYNNNYLTKEQLVYAKQALTYFSEYGDSLYIDNAIYHLALAYHNNGETAMADSLYAQVNPNGRFGASAHLKRATNIMLTSNPEAEKALSHFQAALEMGAVFKLDEWYQYVYAQYVTGNIGYADRLMEQLESKTDDAKSLWWKYAIYYHKQQYKKACDSFAAYSMMRDSLVRKQLQQSLFKAEKEQYRYEAEVAEHDKDNAMSVLAVVVFISLLSLALIALFYFRMKYRLLQKYSLMEQQFSNAQHMIELVKIEASSEIQTTEDKLLSLRSSFAKMYQGQFAMIGELYNKEMSLSIVFDKGRQAYADKVTEIMSEIGDGIEQQKQFEARIDRDLDQIMSKLRSDFPVFSEESFRLLSYCIVGFHTNVIASVMNVDPGTIRTRKSRLRKKILSANSPNQALYEAFLK